MRDCALVLYKYAFFFVPCQVVQRLSIGPALSGVLFSRAGSRPAGGTPTFFFSPLFKFFLDIPAPRFLVL